MSEIPVTRTLDVVLRDALSPEPGLRLVVGTLGTPLTGPEANAYANVVIDGATVKVPKLRQATVPGAGGPAYVLASKDFMLYLGTVTAI
jgi:hypothetical protein